MIEYNIIVGYLFSFRGAKVVFDEREKAERWLARHVQLKKHCQRFVFSGSEEDKQRYTFNEKRNTSVKADKYSIRSKVVQPGMREYRL